MAKELITAEPTKRLFIETLTQDVSLQTCILDLIDNSFDSYVRNGLTDRRIIKITIAKDRFELYDNCGGIDKDHLKNNVFKFGAENTNTTNPTLGMYGIGLKRSIFKIGNLINIQTDDGKNLSTINLNVPLWQESKDWNFEFDVETSSLNKSLPFTNITISNIHSDISEKFALVAFQNEIINAIKKTYCLIIQENIDFIFNGIKIDSFPILVPYDSEYEPNILDEVYDEIEIKIICFIDPSQGKRLKDAVNQIGWNVFCNKRLILSNDISEMTGWKGGGESKDKSMLPKYHTIYNEFRGIVLLTSNNPFKLPLNTSKSGLNVEDRNYHYILNKMILAARPIIDYLTDKYRPEKQEEDDIEKKLKKRKILPMYLNISKLKKLSQEKALSKLHIEILMPKCQTPHA